MDVFLFVLGVLLMIGGIIGCFIPLLPGPPLSYIALLLQQLKSEPLFSTKFLLIWAGITLIVTLLDYIIPLYGTKKFGGTRYGVWGCTIGLLVGLFFPPWGIILGPFAGAFIGEYMANRNSDRAFKAAFGSFLGFLFGTLLKLIVCSMMGWYLIYYTYS